MCCMKERGIAYIDPKLSHIFPSFVKTIFDKIVKLFVKYRLIALPCRWSGTWVPPPRLRHFLPGRRQKKPGRRKCRHEKCSAASGGKSPELPITCCNGIINVKVCITIETFNVGQRPVGQIIFVMSLFNQSII